MDFKRIMAMRAKECEGLSSREAYEAVKKMTDAEVKQYIDSIKDKVKV